ncbi:MAG TPA: zinc dependent phospholipase C family protein [Candidatus Sulfotelmatobacter sp.]|nr:zinc dependent phospholipase C family protein [Candidatus Sulfotelmatobacter sp.]
MKPSPGSIARNACLLLLVALYALHSSAYSVLTHEELIDLAWNGSIRPLLLQRFPNATPEDLREAHAYAYGGCSIQDMGYYPFGKKFFSNLTHYVRTGDFIDWMFKNARTIDELAFAIGALSHYLGDSIGHSQAINPATAIEFPKLEERFGKSVTYGESPHGHIRTEFAFDIDELTDTKFAPPTYLEFIGFKVPRRFLEEAFVNTYGFDVHEVLGRAHPALRSYRTSVRRFIPAFAEAEVVLHRHQFPPHPDDDAFHVFNQRIAQTNYDRGKWKHSYHGPGIRAHLLAVLVFLVPKIGAASDLAIKIPTTATEDRYIRSLNHTLDVFREAVDKLATSPDSPAELANLDLDTGAKVRLGDYALADQTHDDLLARLASRPGRIIPASLKEQMLAYYSAINDPPKQTLERLAILRTMKTR